MAGTIRRYFRGYASDMPFFALKRCFKLPPMGDSGIFDPKYVESIYRITFERGAVGIYIPPLPDLDFVQGNYCNLYGQRGLTYYLAFSSHVPPTNTQTPGMFYYFREHEHNVLDDLHLATKEAEATAYPTVVEAMMRRQAMLAQGPIQGYNPYNPFPPSGDVDPASLSEEFCGPFSHTCTMGGRTYISQNGTLVDISPQL